MRSFTSDWSDVANKWIQNISCSDHIKLQENIVDSPKFGVNEPSQWITHRQWFSQAVLYRLKWSYPRHKNLDLRWKVAQVIAPTQHCSKLHQNWDTTVYFTSFHLQYSRRKSFLLLTLRRLLSGNLLCKQVCSLDHRRKGFWQGISKYRKKGVSVLHDVFAILATEMRL